MLLIRDGMCAADEPRMRMGGIPLVPEDFEWPACRTCDGAMQFLAHLPLDTGTISVFYCQNDPGMCDEWDAASGGTRAYFFSNPLRPAAVPAEGKTLLGATMGLRLQCEETPTRELIMGQVGGDPGWLQNDETPLCPECTSPMAFAAELQEGHDFATAAANFGGSGRGYVFRCDHCMTAAFLWQC
jgi:hypothetical protein